MSSSGGYVYKMEDSTQLCSGSNEEVIIFFSE